MKQSRKPNEYAPVIEVKVPDEEFNFTPSPVGEVEAAPKTAVATAAVVVPTIPVAVAHAAPKVQPPSPATSHVYVATFSIRAKHNGAVTTEIVEVVHTQKPVEDKNAAWKIIKAKHPTAIIKRTAGRIAVRVAPTINIRAGDTIRQLFPDGSEHEAARTIGTVIFDGSLCDIRLRHIRAKSAIAITLRQPGGTVVNFSEQFTTTRLVTDLPKILVDTLGASATTIKLFIRRIK